MAVSKAYLRRLTRVVKDRKRRSAIREFLMKYSDEINTNNLYIVNGELFYLGSIGKVTFYKLWGKFRSRKKSSLDGKRFRKDKAFKGSRESAERFKLGNKLASELYKTVQGEQKQYSLFCFLKKRSIALIKDGRSVEEARDILLDYLKSFELVASGIKPTPGIDSQNVNTETPKSITGEKNVRNILTPIPYYKIRYAEWQPIDEGVFEINSS